MGKAKVLFLFIAICVAASGKAISEERWTTFTKEDGSLIDNAIFSIAVDPFYVWVGMKGGICRFDKRTSTWTRFDPISARFPDLASIPTEMVTDGFGGIWAGVVGVGIVRYDASIGRWERAYQFQEQITGLAYDPLENALWVGVAGENGGLFRFDIAKKTLTRVEGLPTKYADGTPNRDVTSIAMDGDYIWVGTTKPGISIGDVGLARYQKSTGKWTGYQYGSDPGITNPRVHAIAVGQDLVWFGTRGNAVFYYDKRTGRFGIPNPIPSEILSVARAAINVNAIAFGGDYLWLTAGDTFWSRGSSRWNGPGGLLRYDTVSGKWDLLTKSDGLVSDVVWKVAVDGRAVWTGSLEDVASGSPKGFGLSLYEPSEDTARPELRISISPDPVGDNAIATVSLSSNEPLKRATVEIFSEGEASPKRVLSLSQGKTAMEWTGSFSTTGLPAGIAKAMAFGQDKSRNWGTCKTNFGIVDTTPPPVPVLDPIHSPQSSPVVAVSGKTEAGALVSIFVNGVLSNSGNAGPDGRFSVKVNLALGTNTIYAIAMDAAGNKSRESQQLSVVLDTKGPTFTIQVSPSPAKAVDLSITFIASEKLDMSSIKARVTQSGMDPTPIQVSFVGESDGKFKYMSKYTVIPGKDGLATASIEAKDEAGNPGEGTVSFVVDTSPPGKPILDPLPPVVNTRRLKMSGLAEPNSTLLLVLNGKELEAGKVSSSGRFSNIDLELEEGNNDIWMKAMDDAGNVGPESDRVRVFADTIKPMAQLFGPTSWETGIPIEFDGSGSSDNDEVTSYTWDMGDGSPKISGKKISYMYLVPGKYKVMLIVRDRVGLESDPAVLEVDVKKGPPLPPVLVSSVQSPTNKRYLEISGKVGKDVVKVEVNGSTEGVRLLDGQWTYSGQLKEGENRIYVVAYDAEQRASKPLSLIVVLDTTPPEVPSGLSAKAGKSKVVISWKAVPDADRYFVYRSTSETGPWEKISETKETSLEDVDVRNETTYWYSVSALDSLSNESMRSTPVSATPSEKGAVTGKFLDHLGMPVQGVKVILYLGTAKKGEVESGPDGTFVVKGLQEGKYTVVFEPGEGWITPDKMTVEVFAAFTSSLGDIPLEPVPGSLKGRAIGITASGEEIGVANATVEAWYGGKKVMEVRTDGSGSFRFDALVPGRYELRLVTGKEWIPVPPKEVEVKAMETTHVDFKLSSAPGRIYGRVLNAKTGKPVPGIKVEAMVGTEVKGTAMTDDSGSFSIKDLPEQRYRLKAGGPGRREVVSPQPPGLIELSAGGEISHDILIGIPGDFDGNGTIDFEDLMILSVLWNSNDPYADMGPYSGIPPDIVPKGDGKLDIEDLMAFAAMWGWFYGAYARAPISPWLGEREKGLENGFGTGSTFDTISIKAEGVKDLLGVEVEICCDPSGISIAPGALMKDGNGFVATFTKLDKSGNGMRVFLIRLAPGASGVDGDGEVMRIAFKKGEKAPVIKRIELRNSRNGIENARISSEVFRSLPPGSYTYLSQNYPNPFSSPTTIELRLERRGRATLKVYDMMGRRVKTLLDRELQPGIYKLIWDGRGENGIELPSGVYIFVLETDGFKGLRKGVRIKR